MIERPPLFHSIDQLLRRVLDHEIPRTETPRRLRYLTFFRLLLPVDYSFELIRIDLKFFLGNSHFIIDCNEVAVGVLVGHQ